MDGIGPADGVLAGLREAEVADLPGSHQIRHGPHRLLDGRVLVDAVLIVEVDVVDLEAARRVTRLPNELGVPPEGRATLGVDGDEAELGGQDHVFRRPRMARPTSSSLAPFP